MSALSATLMHQEWEIPDGPMQLGRDNPRPTPLRFLALWDIPAHRPGRRAGLHSALRAWRCPTKAINKRRSIYLFSHAFSWRFRLPKMEPRFRWWFLLAVFKRTATNVPNTDKKPLSFIVAGNGMQKIII